MTEKERIDTLFAWYQAIEETKKRHPEINIETYFSIDTNEQFFSSFDFTNLTTRILKETTNSEQFRTVIDNYGIYGLLIAIIEHAKIVTKYGDDWASSIYKDRGTSINPQDLNLYIEKKGLTGYSECRKFTNYISRFNGDLNKIFDFLRMHPKVINSILGSMSMIRTNPYIRDQFDNYFKISLSTEQKRYSRFNPRNRERQQVPVGIKNVVSRDSAIERFTAMSAICDQQLPSSTANIGKYLYASSNMGLKRTNNEDMYLIATHPSIPDFSIALVADGMGGVDKGEVASRFVAEELNKWFMHLDSRMYERSSDISNALRQEIENINNRIPAGGTTLACIINCKDEAVTATVGDSRIYKISEPNGLEQIGHDHSRAVTLGFNNRSAMYYRGNNIVEYCLDGDPRHFGIDLNIIKRSEYFSLHAMSDGLTDLISENAIGKIIKTSKSLEEVQKRLIELANSHQNPDLKVPKDLEVPELLASGDSSRMFRSNIAGKDNETIVSVDNSGYQVRRR